MSKTPEKNLPSHDDLPDHLFGHFRFRRVSFRQHMLETFPAFEAALREKYAEEDAVALLANVEGDPQ